MCLEFITMRIEKPTKKVVMAWKRFSMKEGDPDHIYPAVIQVNASPIKFGVWCKARNVVGLVYKLGFHAYKTRREAGLHDGVPTLPTYKVALRGVRTIGVQGAKRVLVADEMKVLRSWKRR